MIIFSWNEEKNRKLYKDRDICFDNIVQEIIKIGYFELIKHTNPKKYPHQKIILVKIYDHIYLIPCLKTKSGYFLKTLFASRKLTKLYKNLEKEGYEKTKIRL